MRLRNFFSYLFFGVTGVGLMLTEVAALPKPEVFSNGRYSVVNGKPFFMTYHPRGGNGGNFSSQ